MALAVGDEVWMLENAVYSVISPEGCASILWKDAKKNKEAAECLKLTAEDMKQMKVIERIIPEEGLKFSGDFCRSGRTALENSGGESFAKSGSDCWPPDMSAFVNMAE